MSDDLLTDDLLDDLEDGDDKEKKRGRRRIGRRDKKDKNDKKAKATKADKSAAVAATASAASASNEDAKPSGLAGIRQWAIDSYNGIFKIVVEPQLPSYRVLGYMIMAFLFGMFWAYSIAPTVYYNGAPHQMRSEHQDQHVVSVAGAALAQMYSQADVQELLSRVDDPERRIARLLEATPDDRQTEVALQLIQPWAQGIDGRNAPSPGSFFSSLIGVIVAVILFIAISWVVALAWGLLIGGYVTRARLGIKRRLVGESDEDKAARATMDAERKRKEVREQMEREAKEAGASAMGPALTTKPSIYFKGRSYDDSFAIEDANDMFLGEMGATIARTVGDNKDLAAVEVWLFDKDDFTKTYTKVFVAPHTLNDPAAMNDLGQRVDNPDSDIVVLTPGAELDLISKTIIVKAKVVDVTPGSDPGLPPNSHFDGLTLQMQAWQTDGTPTPAAAPVAASAAGGLPDLSSYEIGPPPEMPSSMPPPTSSGQRDLSEYEIGPPPPGIAPVAPARPPAGSPPPAGLPPIDDDDDDDPFGGTADFTPVGN